MIFSTATRQTEEVTLVSQTIKDIEQKEAELTESLSSLSDSMKRDKITILKVSVGIIMLIYLLIFCFLCISWIFTLIIIMSK